MDLPTYTNIWRIEKRLYKLYDFRLPMPLPINWIAVFAGLTIPYVILLIAVGLPFNHDLVWLYVLPPGLLTWLTTRPVIENKRLPELVESQVRYLTEPRTWIRLAPLSEKDQMELNARVWRSRPPRPPRRSAAAPAAARGPARPALPALPAPSASQQGQRVQPLRPGQVLRPTLVFHPERAVAGLAPGQSSRAGQPPATPRRLRDQDRSRPGQGRPRPQPAGGSGAWPPPVLPSAPIPALASLNGNHQAPVPSADLTRPTLLAGDPPGGSLRGDDAVHAMPDVVPPAATPQSGASPAPAVPPAPLPPAPLPPVPAVSPGPRPAAPAAVVAPPAAPPAASPAAGAAAARPASAAPAAAAATAASAPAPLVVPPLVVPPLVRGRAPGVGAPPLELSHDEPRRRSAERAGAAPEASFAPPAWPAAPARQPQPQPEPEPQPEALSPSDAAPQQPAAGPGAEKPVPTSDPAPKWPVPARPPRPVPPAAPEALAPEAPAPPAGDGLAEGAPGRPEDLDASQVPAGHPAPVPDHAAVAGYAPVPAAAPAPVPAAAPAPVPDAVPVPAPEPAPVPEPAVQQVGEPAMRVLPSVERALSGPARDRNAPWSGKVKIVTGHGAAQGPGARDQEAQDRNRARLPLADPKRVLVLGCTSGAGQSVTALMTASMLASLREHLVAVVDLHDGMLARHRVPAAWLEDLLAGRPPQVITATKPDGLHPTAKPSPARVDVIASHEPLGDGDDIKMVVQLNRHYPLTVIDPGAAGLNRLLKIADQLVVVVPANTDAAGALADTREWLDNNGHADLASQSVTVINGVSRRSLPDVEQAESIARGRSRAIVRVPWDDLLPAAAAGPATLRPQTRVAYTALAGVLVAGLNAAPARKK